MPVQAKFHDWMQATYEHFGCFWDRQQESCKETLRVVWDVHHQALAAAALLEGHIKRLGCSVTHGWSSSQGRSGSQQCSRSRRHTGSHMRCLLTSQEEQVPLVEDHTGDPARRQAVLPSPVRLRRRVTFEDSSPSRDTKVKQAPPPNMAGRQSPEATGSWP